MKMLFIHVMQRTFSVSLLQSSESHDPSEAIAARETFLITINVEKICAAQSFCENRFSLQDSLNKKVKFKC